MIKPEELSAADRWLLVVKGLVRLTVDDQEGRRIGFRNEPEFSNLVENHIPGATYRPGKAFSSVFLNQAGVYTFTFFSQGAHSSHISLSLFNSVAKLDTFFFQGVPMTLRSRAQLVYNTANQSAMPILALDREGNGEVKQIEPTILNAQASGDVIPPTTNIDINDDIVTISASDNPGGAGVLRTYYTTDGVTRAVYSEPFPLPPDAKVVMAYSEDRAGNLEYPGTVRPVLGLSDNKVVLKVRGRTKEIVQHSVDVINLDPISSNSELEWEAATDVPWLSVEPSVGTTPYPITLSVRSVDLVAKHAKAKVKVKSTTYKANVIVRSLTPGTLFAERTIHVRVAIASAEKAQRKSDFQSATLRTKKRSQV